VIETLTTHLTLAAHMLGHAVRRRERVQDDAGMSTLEVVVIAVGLLVIAGIAVAALTAAVNRRIAQIQ